MSGLISQLPKSWIMAGIPGCRPGDGFGTYYDFDYDALPPLGDIPRDFAWLKAQPELETSIAVKDSDFFPALSAQWETMKNTSGLTLPPEFIEFITSPDLQSRVFSVTACYLLLPEFIVRTTGTEEGFLIHFLSDQQWCAHWHLYVNMAGEYCVLVSSPAYGFPYDESEDPNEDEDEDDAENDIAPSETRHSPPMPDNPINLEEEPVSVCAMSFTEFLYRYWLENSLWINLVEKNSLTPVEQAYADYYLKPI